MKAPLGQAATDGQTTIALVARPGRVGRALLKQTPVLALLTGVPGMAAVIEEQEKLAAALVFPTIALVGASLWSRQLKTHSDLRRIEALVTLALVFGLSALLCAPAFIALGLPPLDAVFEGVSGITTTGLSMAVGAEEWPISGHFLRAWMQWCGGVVVAVAGVALLMDSGRAAMVMGRASVGTTDYLASARSQARLILAGYVVLTVVGIIGATALIPGWWEGAMVALAAVSTGGFTPRDASLAEYSLPAQAFVMALCIAGAVSLLFYASAMKRGIRDAVSHGTVLVTLGIITTGTAGYVLIQGATSGWDAQPLITGALNHISAQTTAGFSAAPVAPVGPMLLVLIVAMILGGDVGSTTGGIKTGRAVTVFAAARQILFSFRVPDRGVVHLKIAGRRASSERMVFSAALIGTYAISVAVFWLALMIGDHPPLPAIFDAVSALSGVGLSAGVIGPDLAAPLKIMAIFAMLLGRLEFFALIVLFLPSTWISRR